MGLIANNSKKVGVFNALLLVIAAAFAIYRFTVPTQNVMILIRDAVYLISVVFGFLYALLGYRKNAAVYYKLFMVTFAVFAILVFVADIDGSYSFIMIFRAIVAVCALILAFSKNLGKDRSKLTVYIALASQFIYSVIKVYENFGAFRKFATVFMHLVIVCVACVFVLAKYADKQARGAEDKDVDNTTKPLY